MRETGEREAAASTEREDRHFVTALARGLDLLACFRSSDRMLGNQELAQRCKLPRSTVSRLTYTLTKLGYLHYEQSAAKYRLGTATLALGSAILSRLDVRQLARPAMQQLADFSGAMVSLGTRDRLSMIYVENCRSQAALTLSLDVGSRIQIVRTAMGRAYLALAPDSERDEILARAQALDPANWAATLDGVHRSLKEYQQFGCCTVIGEWQPDVNAIAVAIRPGDGSMPISINCGGPASHLSVAFLLQEVRPRLLALVHQLSGTLAA